MPVPAVGQVHRSRAQGAGSELPRSVTVRRFRQKQELFEPMTTLWVSWARKNAVHELSDHWAERVVFDAIGARASEHARGRAPESALCAPTIEVRANRRSQDSRGDQGSEPTHKPLEAFHPVSTQEGDVPAVEPPAVEEQVGGRGGARQHNSSLPLPDRADPCLQGLRISLRRPEALLYRAPKGLGAPSKLGEVGHRRLQVEDHGRGIPRRPGVDSV